MKILIWLFVLCLTALLLGFWARAEAHDRWENGDPVPQWVRSACCGPNDVHHIPNEDIRIMADGYHINGLTTVIPFRSVLSSPDNTYWGFWRPIEEPAPYIFCFFAPPQGS